MFMLVSVHLKNLHLHIFYLCSTRHICASQQRARVHSHVTRHMTVQTSADLTVCTEQSYTKALCVVCINNRVQENNSLNCEENK